MTELKIRDMKDGAFPINEALAGLVPMAIPSEQAALTGDIDENGQREAIILWRGEVVDGRCRQAALTLLGNRDIKYKELDDKLTEDEVAMYVKSVNTRRNLTLTQKIVIACKDSYKDNKSIVKSAKEWGVGKGSIDNARFIHTHRPELLEVLFNGNAVAITDKDGNDITTNKITTVWAYVSREVEKLGDPIEEEHAWRADSAINTQVGKEWFYEFIKTYSIKNVDVMKELAIAANAKFVLAKPEVNQ